MQSDLIGSLVDFSELMKPKDINTHKQRAYIPFRDGNNVAIHQDHLYIVSMDNCMISVYYIRDPYHLVKTGSIQVGGKVLYYMINYPPPPQQPPRPQEP